MKYIRYYNSKLVYRGVLPRVILVSNVAYDVDVERPYMYGRSVASGGSSSTL